MVSKILGGIIAFFTLFVVLDSWYTVDQGERGVILRYGAVVGNASPGLGFKVPIIDDVEYVSVQSHAPVWDNVVAYSRDQQSANIRLSVSYRIPPDQVSEVYSNYGSVDNLISRLLERRVFEISKTVFGQYNAVTAIQERGKLNADIAHAIQEAVRGPILIESVQIENIDFSDAYEKSIEDRMLAEVEVQKLRQNAEREKVQAQIVVTQAKAQADSVREKAIAEAEAIRLRGEAEATAIKARASALADNPSLVELTKAERWNGTLPTTMVPGGSVPMIGMSR